MDKQEIFLATRLAPNVPNGNQEKHLIPINLITCIGHLTVRFVIFFFECRSKNCVKYDS